jgi:hypothetical protein
VRALIRSTLVRQLAALDDAGTAGAQSWAELLGVPAGAVAEKLIDNLLQALDQEAPAGGSPAYARSGTCPE